MVELEAPAILDGALAQLTQLANDSGLGDIWQTITAGYAEASPTGGAHFLYRVDAQ
jgi:putative DNA primase/helicase